ncbi:MAG: CDP-diacylglycerol--serine O-phosphatidyltransferase [Bacteroidales bacterium]|jgi:CDP-diacylglycerol--serine O-phosphatidyltransferase|nr:CDP-diacylglycerol--serine O-phosphatidyltransferase [Bacteroidales bacterium]
MFKKQIPNSITALNLLSGIFAIVATFEGALLWAGFFIALGAFFDFFDGLAARMLNIKSDMGKEMDSLADLVSFGVAPGFIVYQLMLQSSNIPHWILFNHNIAPYLAFLIPVFGAFRLAKFNIDTRQTTSFIGLPTPATALFFGSLPFILSSTFSLDSLFLQNWIANYWILLSLVFLISILMIAELPLFSLKFSNFKWHDNSIRFVFLSISIALLIFLQIAAFPLIILLYIILSLIQNLSGKN